MIDRPAPPVPALVQQEGVSQPGTEVCVCGVCVCVCVCLYTLMSQNIMSTDEENEVDYLLPNSTCQGLGYIEQEANSWFSSSTCWMKKNWAGVKT